MDKRKAGILLACLLGSVLLLYLGGLLGQLLYNYEEWMRQDGMTGGVLMAELKASPLYCIPYAFTASGLKGTLFLLLLSLIHIWDRLQLACRRRHRRSRHTALYA